MELVKIAKCVIKIVGHERVRQEYFMEGNRKLV